MRATLLVWAMAAGTWGCDGGSFGTQSRGDADDADPASRWDPCGVDVPCNKRGFVCLGALCQPDPAAGRDDACIAGETAQASCVPVGDPCAGLDCGPGSTCVAGVCVPGCFACGASEGAGEPSPGDPGGSLEEECGKGAGVAGAPEGEAGGTGDSTAGAGAGVACPPGKHFLLGVCVDTIPCDGECPDGTVCHLSCSAPIDAAAGLCGDEACDVGFLCVAGTCVQDLCAGVDCSANPAAVCVNGSCVDTCDCGPAGCGPGQCCVFGHCVAGGAPEGDHTGDSCEEEQPPACEGSCPVDGACGADDGCGHPCPFGKCPQEDMICIDTVCYCAGCNEDADCGADDGCGHACPIGKCDPGHVCITGLCECVPTCPADGACGDDDGCGGLCDGACPAGERCDRGACVCAPDCATATCGAPDECGGECQGSCPAGRQCVAQDGHWDCACAPTCAADGACGGPDGCGGTCAAGVCPTGQSCQGGLCVNQGCDACACGEICVAGACLALCSAGQTLCGCNACCNAGEVCDGGACIGGVF